MMGKCKLCLRDGIELQLSHLISAGVYRVLRDAGEKNPNPWLLKKGVAVQTSKQTRAPLLCRDCELRFSKYGENWVLKQCLKPDRSFPLAQILASRTPDASSATSSTKVYYAARIPEVDVSALSYFAASIFWRASVYPWTEDDSVPVKLGPFREEFRKYLLGLTAFPKHSALSIAIRQGGNVDRLAFEPTGSRRDGCHVHLFAVPGLAFAVAVGKRLPVALRNTCFVRGGGNPLVVSERIEPVLKGWAEQLLSGAR